MKNKLDTEVGRYKWKFIEFLKMTVRRSNVPWEE
jgi:hypothetical protein